MKFTSAGGVPLIADPQAPTVIVKDGTVSSRQEKHLKETEADAERRRSHQDTQKQMSRQGIGGGGVARLGSRRLLTEDSPRLVLHYRKWNQQCDSEITMINSPLDEGGGLDTMFTLVCPKCLQRGVPQGQAQLQVRNSHRKFDVDTSKAGSVVVYAGTSRYMRYVHGTVTVKDTVRCSNTGCGWGARIIDSVVDDV